MHATQTECMKCHRHLRPGLFHKFFDGSLCNACLNRKTKREQNGRGVSSVNHTFITDDIQIPPSVPDPFAYIQAEKAALAQSLRSALAVQGQIKWYPSSSVSFTKQVGENTARFPGHFAAVSKILLNEADIDDQIEESVHEMLEKMQDFTENGSDYVVENLNVLEIKTAVYNPVGGSSFIDLPLFLANKYCIINVRNDDNRCFEYSILAQLHPSKNNKNKA